VGIACNMQPECPQEMQTFYKIAATNLSVTLFIYNKKGRVNVTLVVRLQS
jgi:hypothetical protein